MNHLSIEKIEKLRNLYSKRGLLSNVGCHFVLSENGVLAGRVFSLFSSSFSRVGFAAFVPTLRSLKAQGSKGLPVPRQEIASMFKSVFCEWNSKSSRLHTRYLLVSLYYAPTLDSLYFFKSFVPWRFGVVEPRAKWIDKKSNPLDN